MSSPTWEEITSPDFEETANRIICENPPCRRSVAGVVPVDGVPGTTGRYALFRVLFDDGTRRVARIGAVPDPEAAAVDNSGFLGTAIAAPAGQKWEAAAAALAAEAGVPALVPDAVTAAGGVEIMWLPLLKRTALASDPVAWQSALAPMPNEQPGGFPVFTDRARKLAVLHSMGTGTAARLGDRYDLWLETLFEEATRWSVVHGSPAERHALAANGDNGANGGITVVDFAESCWAPVAWEASGLVAAGIATRNEATALFGLTKAEMEAAVTLRSAGAAIMSASVHPSAGLRAA